ncbi:MAG: hypothetical protein LBP35_05585 [Candidatus Ancillula trichonymphae]|jgi:N-acetylglucosamine-6-phosphate deacetylase|nr:hypothetical protein [Candidatus Ancillula trichonymphae]
MIDIHCHGGAGVAFDDASADLDVALNMHKLHGTSKHCISLITAPWEDILKNVQRVSQFARKRADILGIHLEGPFISSKAKGAHDRQHLLIPSKVHLDELLEAADGQLLHITLAPELGHTRSLIRHLRDAGVMCAIGHTAADYNTTMDALKAGATHVTHLFNAMNSIHHRVPGPILAAYDYFRLGNQISVELVCDGVHVLDPIVRLVFDMFTNKQGQTAVVLITDAMSAAGMNDGNYGLGSLSVTVTDSKAYLTGTTTLAGSTLTMSNAVQNALRAGIEEELVVQASHFVPYWR